MKLGSDKNIITTLSSSVLLDRTTPWCRQRQIHVFTDCRYFNDLSFFTNNKFQLRRLIKDVVTLVKALGLRLAQKKTWVGRTTQGLDFLGYHLSRQGLSIAQYSWVRSRAKSLQLYEQGASIKRLQADAKKWISWAHSGVTVTTRWLKLKTTILLQNICGETLLFE
jgi:hypothetical protein